MKQKALRAGVAHSHEDEECRKRLRSARECAVAHSFLELDNYGAFPNKMLKKEGKKNGTENVDCTWTCSQKSAASKSQDDVSGSTGADFIGSAVYQ